MVDHSAHTPAAHGAGDHDDHEVFDAELNVRGIVITGLSIAGGTIVSCVLMWWLMAGFHAFDGREPVKPSPMPEVAAQPVAPAPHLQSYPEEDMRMLRAQEDLALEHSAWVDEKQGTVRLPVDLAIDVLAEKGLPKSAGTPLPAAAGDAPTAATPTDRPTVGSILPPAGQGLATTAPTAGPTPAPPTDGKAPAGDANGKPVPPPTKPPGAVR
jgi:hypothetical protein